VNEKIGISAGLLETRDEYFEYTARRHGVFADLRLPGAGMKFEKVYYKGNALKNWCRGIRTRKRSRVKVGSASNVRF